MNEAPALNLPTTFKTCANDFWRFFCFASKICGEPVTTP